MRFGKPATTEFIAMLLIAGILGLGFAVWNSSFHNSAAKNPSAHVGPEENGEVLASNETTATDGVPRVSNTIASQTIEAASPYVAHTLENIADYARRADANPTLLFDGPISVDTFQRYSGVHACEDQQLHAVVLEGDFDAQGLIPGAGSPDASSPQRYLIYVYDEGKSAAFFKGVSDTGNGLGEIVDDPRFSKPVPVPPEVANDMRDAQPQVAPSDGPSDESTSLPIRAGCR